MVLDATVAGAAADSYISLAAADVFAAGRPTATFTTKWRDATTTTDNKEAALRQATSDIDAYVRVSSRYVATQALRFPRATDYTGTAPNKVAFIPPRIKEACYEQAIYLVSVADLQDQAAERRARALFSFNEENVSGSLAVDADFGRLAPRAEALVRSIVTTRAAFTGSVPIRSGTVATFERASS